MRTFKILTGYFLIALSVIIAMSVFSFNPSDCSFFTSRVNFPPQNMVGSLGARISSFLIVLYGEYASYLLAFASLVIGINFLTHAKAGRILMKLSLFLMAAPSLSIAIAALKNNAHYQDSGLIGILVFRYFPPFFSPPVVSALFFFIALLSLSATMKIFRVMTSFFAKTVGMLILSPFQLLGLLKENKTIEIEPDPFVVENDPNHLTENPKEEIKKTKPSFLKTEGNTPSLSSSPPSSGPNWLDQPRIVLDEIDQLYDPVLNEEKTSPEKEITKEINVSSQEEESLIHDSEPEKNVVSDESVKETSEIQNTPEEQEIQSDLFHSENFEDDEEEEKLELEIQKNEPPQSSALKHKGFFYPKVSDLEQNFDNITREEEKEEIESIKKIIENTFASFKIEIQISGYSRGPAITRYEIVPPQGLKLRSIVNLTDDLALKLGTRNIRIVAPIGNRSMIGVEVPNRHRRNVVLRSIIENKSFKDTKAQLPLILGKDIAGKIIIEDLSVMPHLLIAGTTGSGKSVYVNSLISGLVFKLNHEELKFIMIDPKMVELELYNGIPHLLAPVITQPENALAALEWAAEEMDRRYKLLSQFGVRNIADFNKMIDQHPKMTEGEEAQSKIPFIVIVIDEFANLMLRSPKETEKVISRLASMARAVGIHLVIATQRPSVDVVTGIIKANFPSRIAFRVSSKTDSRTILDKNGAERLLGRGDMLFMTPNSTEMYRIQSPFASNKDIETIVFNLKQNGTADYQINLEELSARFSSDRTESEITVDASEDPIFGEVLKTAVENGEVSASFIQRRFRVGYNRASRLVDAMEQMGILSASTGSSKPRTVLIQQEDLVHYL